MQTIVSAKKLTNTPKQARQLIVHKHISIENQTVNIPSYQVSLEEEPEIKTKAKLEDEIEKLRKELES